MGDMPANRGKELRLSGRWTTGAFKILALPKSSQYLPQLEQSTVPFHLLNAGSESSWGGISLCFIRKFLMEFTVMSSGGFKPMVVEREKETGPRSSQQVSG